MLPNEILCMM